MSLAGTLTSMTGRRLSALPVVAFVLALVLALPLIAITVRAFAGSTGTLAYLVGSILPEIVANSLMLATLVALIAAGIGIGAAALVSFCRFPLSRAFEWLLLLPLAMPAYIIGYAYTDALAFAGPVQKAIRASFGLSRGEYWFPDIHNLPGAAVLLALVLYPYVYLTVRGAFLEQSAEPFEAARLLGRKPLNAFLTVALPMARPAVMGGVALVVMETLADFATVQYFGVNTFTTAIYRAWFGMGDKGAAAQVALVLVMAVVALVLIERLTRRRQHFAGSARRVRTFQPVPLTGFTALAAMAGCALPVLLGFIVPVIALIRLHVGDGDALDYVRFIPYAWHSLILALTAALLVTLGAGLVASAQRLFPSLAGETALRLAALGYALPGTVVAVGVLIALGLVDGVIDSLSLSLRGVGVGLLLSGTIAALLYAYAVRFAAVALGPLESGLARIPMGVDYAARTLGSSPATVARRLHVPLMRRSMLIAMLGVFVDTMKELPATLIVRPFDFDTLAVRVYNLASDERLAQASTGALAIVIVGILPVLLLSRLIRAR